MAKIELGRNLKQAIQGAADSAKTAADTLKTAAKDVKIPDTVKDAFQKKHKEEHPSADETMERTANKEETRPAIKAIPSKSAMKIFYYLMAVDGQILQSEEEKFNSIGMELDPDFLERKDQIVRECRMVLDLAANTDAYYETVQNGVWDAIISPVQEADSLITLKLLVWDLLTIAYSDESYDTNEKKLLDFVVEGLDIDQTEYLELESSMLTLMDIDRELAWIKTTDRPYLKVEAMVNELQDRRNVIFESVKDLIML